MTYDPLGGGPLDYLPCRYGTSKLLFRGPKRRPDGTHVAVLGGTESYGKFIETPWPDMLEQVTGRQVVNLAQMNAGVDVYLNDRSVQDLCQQSHVTVIELMGAQNLSNRFYAVHPRRNDRFLRASTLMKTIYREIDFTEFHFTRHLLAGLRDASAEKFEMITGELKDAWVARMQKLIETVSGQVVLLWMADHPPGADSADPLARSGPLLVDARMIDVLRPRVSAVVEIVAGPEERAEGFGQMHFGEMDSSAAAELLGPVVHKRAAQRLGEAIRALDV
jgi:hypothetical protein